MVTVPVAVLMQERGQLLTMVVVALATALMKDTGQALTMVVAPAAVLMGERGLVLKMVMAIAAALMKERGLVLKMVVAPAIVHMEARRLTLTVFMKSAQYLLNQERIAPILVVARIPLCMRDIKGKHYYCHLSVSFLPCSVCCSMKLFMKKQWIYVVFITSIFF